MLHLVRLALILGIVLSGVMAPVGAFAQADFGWAGGPSESRAASSLFPADAENFDSLLHRLAEAERRIAELEAGHAELSTVPPEPNDALADMTKYEAPEPLAPIAEAVKKGKEWYEKYGLRGYAQFRYNDVPYLADGSAPPMYPGDSSVGDDHEFFIRRARLIFSADISDHLYVYLQPDFVVTPPGSPDATNFVQMRDWYADVYVDKTKVNRFRVGQSKVPYGWENMQSSSNRVPLDRHDAFNSATRNERDIGVFYYFTPEWTQEMFEDIMDKGLKHSGNYGMFAFGVYNGQGGSLQEQNDSLHLISRLTWPMQFANGQYLEVGIQGFIGDYVVLGSPIRPLGQGGVDVIPAGTKQSGNPEGILERRLGWSFIYYPQPIGFQSEWTVGEGPGLNDEQTAVERRPLYGGYAMLLYKLDDCHGTWFPFLRWQYYKGGYRSYRNAPFAHVDEWDLGVEWQIRKEMELTLSYCFTDRTNLNAISSSAPVSQESYRQFDGQILRAQFQFNY